MMSALLIAAAGAASTPASPGAETPTIVLTGTHPCKSEDSTDILVCGRRDEHFRIDPNVLEAEREANALPPKPPMTGDETAQSNACVGPDACKGGVIPLVGMALTAVKAAELAATGGDWRDAIRTQPDQYRIYKEAEERRAKDRKVTIGIAVGSK